MGNAVNAIKDTASKVWGGIKDTAGKVAGVVSGIAGKVGEGVNWVKDKVEAARNLPVIGGAVSSILDSNPYSQAAQRVINTVGDYSQRAGDIANTVQNVLK